MATKQSGKGLEKSLQELEKLVNKLESGNSNLDESLKLFEDGIQMYKYCRQELGKAEKKISKLTSSLKEEVQD